LNRDPRIGFIAYVPGGSVEHGKSLVSGEGSQQCVACHGADLHGTGDVPPLGGRTANYIVRQLYMFQSGERAGTQSAPMIPVAEKLSIDDMLDIAAYAASLKP
jgi:cytochrome c553